MPLIWLFGTRNNVLLWITGWDFATYNNFHRWVARVSTVQAVVHSMAYTISIFRDGGWLYFMKFLSKRYFLNGEFATVAMVAICCFSVYGLRRSYYEIFLFLHIILSIVVLITMWYHVEIFDGEYDGFIWPCVYMWLFDRMLRVLRILSFNIKFWSTEAIATYDSDCNIVRLAVPYTKSLLEPQPGAFYYVYVLNSRKFWESHPFTLAYATKDEDSAEESRAPSPSLGTITPPHRVSTPASEPESSVSTPVASGEMSTLLGQSKASAPYSMTFIIRPYDGFTRRLKESAQQTVAKSRVLIEGPYGHTLPLHKYQNVLFIAGGTGIAMPLSYITSLLLPTSSTISSLHIVWAVREHEFLDQVIKTDFRGSLDDERLILSAYITRPREVDKSDEEIPAYPKALSVFHGRPNVRKEVEDMSRDARGEGLAVVACGPGMMADDARAAVVGVLGTGKVGVDYFEESFNW
ncbi:hypothetical protein BP5796_06636 [Coleophoma crateriformis]|uniref:FAD-binding FR-type domain-containing protein n=1 Tax=Coleophoma crateriformis TaxID=565419 RepID=A0A3D8RP82_9HELO|nr:hypothetical protein BP5796_06636 [Coleophoma crateriformis]